MSNKLADRMKAKGVTADELSQLTRIAPGAIAAYLDGKAEPDPDSAYLLDRALDGSRRAQLGTERIRSRQSLPLSGSEVARVGAEIPTYGSGYQSETGGAPK